MADLPEGEREARAAGAGCLLVIVLILILGAFLGPFLLSWLST